MSKLDRYLSRELAQSTFAALVVLLIVSLGGVFADVLSDIARGRVPAKLMLAQLGLSVISYMPLILPLGLMLGLMLGVGRLYRDSEMPVLTSVGIGPRRLLRPLSLVVGPMLLVIGACSLWLGPWARDYSQQMIEAGQRSLLVTGLEAGRFVEFRRWRRGLRQCNVRRRQQARPRVRLSPGRRAYGRHHLADRCAEHRRHRALPASR